jgi:transketolase
MMRVLPNMTVICPGDAIEVRLALAAAFKHGGPVYIRLGKKNEPIIHNDEPVFQIGKGILIREGGKEVCLLSTGNILPVVLETANLLATHGIEAQVVSMHTVKPLDECLLEKVFSQFKIVATVEEHSLIGGLGGSVAEWLSGQRSIKADLLRFGVKDEFIHGAGKQKTARQSVGIDAEIIAKGILKRKQGNLYNNAEAT